MLQISTWHSPSLTIALEEDSSAKSRIWLGFARVDGRARLPAERPLPRLLQVGQRGINYCRSVQTGDRQSGRPRAGVIGPGHLAQPPDRQAAEEGCHCRVVLRRDLQQEPTRRLGE